MTEIKTTGMKGAMNDGHTAVILPLPQDVIAQIRSSTIITTLTGAILGLVRNSLDAGANRIKIDVDFARGGCTVEDDGCGILPSEFEISGGLGKMYHTSKYAASSQTHGAYGTFIAALSALCSLTLTSKHDQHRSVNSLIVHHSNIVARLLPAPEAHQLENRKHGTKITIRNIFGNMPVRVKQRALLFESRAEVGKLWEDLRSSLITLLIAYASPVTLQLKEIPTNRRCILGATSKDIRMLPRDETTVGLASRYRLALSILSRSGKIHGEYLSTWIPASANSRSIAIKGIISLVPVATKSIQYISLDVTPLPRSTHSLVYDHVNRLFGVSRFGATEYKEIGEGGNSVQLKNERFTGEREKNEHRLFAKGVDRWPMFILTIQFKEKPVTDRELLSSDYDLAMVVKVLDALVSSWLKVHHFMPSKSQRVDPIEMVAKEGREAVAEGEIGKATAMLTSNSPDRQRPETLSTSSVSAPREVYRLHNGGEMLQGYSRIRTSYGLPPVTPKLIKKRPTSAPAAARGSVSPVRPRAGSEKHIDESFDSGPNPPNAARNNQHFEAHSSSITPNNLEIDDQGIYDRALDYYVDLADTVPLQVSKINARTGAAVPQSILKPCNLAERRVSISPNVSLKVGSCPDTTWLDQVLHQWDNPVFQNREESIAQASFDLPRVDISSFRKNIFDSREINQAFAEVSQFNATKISRYALTQATVIAQVDKKFILAVVPRLDPCDALRVSLLLVAIDQHAADERCRIEDLLEQLCLPSVDGDDPFISKFGTNSGIKTISLSKTIRFSVPANEVDCFRRHAAYFTKWGILYETSQGRLFQEDSVETIVEVKTLPPVVAERCRHEPKLLITLLRSEIWRREEDGCSFRQPTSSIDNQTNNTAQDLATRRWLAMIADCPQQLLEMLNSRACRSAIMFNDDLTIEESEDLIKRLSKCAFPFQCAHGRPSMVPLIDIGNLTLGSEHETLGWGLGREDFEAWRTNGQEDFARAYGRWQQSPVSR